MGSTTGSKRVKGEAFRDLGFAPGAWCFKLHKIESE